jgi:hypothetical protein
MIINQILVGFVNGEDLRKIGSLRIFLFYFLGLKSKIKKQGVSNALVLIDFYHEKHRMVQRRLC